MSEVKILLCDDDPDLLGLLIRRLKKMGIEPDNASDGREAKSLVDANNYDVIVTDIYMPEASGLEVMQYAKEKDADTQVVIITSSATLDNAIDALNHGSFGYLTKPFDHLIVFDNMVSRALEYRMLVVADKRKAEAQKRRGDMLEEEVAERVRQIQKNQKGLLDLLGSLPDGILVVDESGKVVLTSPVGERWLALDQQSEDQMIHRFINQAHAENPDTTADVTVNGVDLHIMSADFRDDGEVKRKAIIIREMDEDGAGAGSMVTDTVMEIKKGLAALSEQGMGTGLLNVASQFAVLEQLQGWSTGTGELAAAKAPPAPVPTKAPTEATQPEPALASAQEQSPAPTAPSPGVENGEGAIAAPPFTRPRERTATGELDGPRLNTSELQDALRAAAPPDIQQHAAEPPMENAIPQEIVAEPQIHPSDPTEETLVSSTAGGEDSYEEPLDGVAAVEALAAAQHEESDPQVPEALVDKAAPEVPVDSIVQPIDSGTAAPGHSEAQAPEIEEGAPVESPASAPPPEVEIPSEPSTHPAGAAATDEAPAPPSEDPELSGDPIPEPPSFPRAEASTGDLPSWSDGIAGNTDPNLLADFEFESEQSEPTFPKDQTGDLEDDSIYRPRVIPEEVNAKLKTPTELPNANGDREYAPPEHEGPITIQASQADTQMFRNVLAGLSGTQVLSGDHEQAPGEPPMKNGDAVAKAVDGLDELVAAEEGMNELRSAVREAPEPEVPIEAPQAEASPPSAEEIRQVQESEPEPQPVHAKPANWPPTLPTEDDDWDDELDISEKPNTPRK
jgi:DNA-binding response OmpR family regulator